MSVLMDSTGVPYARQIMPVTGKKLSDAEKKESEKKIEALRKEESREVEGIFKNLEVPGGDVTFSFRKYKGDPVTTYTFKDNHRYKIPIGVARHLNNQCSIKQHTFLLDDKGRQITGPGETIHRYSFQSLEFS